jgi:hypothetical protein
MKTLADGIKRDLRENRRGLCHCFVGALELSAVWPKLDQQGGQVYGFARKHNLRLLFYQRSIGAIFGKVSNK